MVYHYNFGREDFMFIVHIHIFLLLCTTVDNKYKHIQGIIYNILFIFRYINALCTGFASVIITSSVHMYSKSVRSNSLLFLPLPIVITDKMSSFTH